MKIPKYPVIKTYTDQNTILFKWIEMHMDESFLLNKQNIDLIWFILFLKAVMIFMIWS